MWTSSQEFGHFLLSRCALQQQSRSRIETWNILKEAFETKEEEEGFRLFRSKTRELWLRKVGRSSENFVQNFLGLGCCLVKLSNGGRQRKRGREGRRGEKLPMGFKKTVAAWRSHLPLSFSSSWEKTALNVWWNSRQLPPSVTYTDFWRLSRRSLIILACKMHVDALW